MMNRSLVLVACALLLLLSGCSGSQKAVGVEHTTTMQEDDGVAANETEIQTDDTSSERVEDNITYPPGTSEQRITNISVLYREHTRVLLDSDYEAQFDFTGDYALRDPEQYSAVQQTWLIKSDLDDRERLFTQTNTFEGGNVTKRTWYDDEGVYYVKNWGQSADGTDHEPYYYVDRRWSKYSFQDHHVMFTRMIKYPVYNQFFKEHEPRHSDTFVRGNATYHLYRVPKDGSDTSGRVLVREDGFIKSIQIHTTIDDHSANFSRNITLRSDVSIDQPDWQKKAMQAEQRRSASGGGDTAADGCGTNDGDPDYNEDNDRDNDGLCDES